MLSEGASLWREGRHGATLNLGLLEMKDDMQIRATAGLLGKALMITVMGILLRRHQAREGVSHLLSNTSKQICGSGLRMNAIIFGFNEPESVAINGSKVDGFNAVPHPGEIISIEEPLVQFGDLPGIWRLKRQPINNDALHQSM
jgi:hypothetical protein